MRTFRIAITHDTGRLNENGEIQWMVAIETIKGEWLDHKKHDFPLPLGVRCFLSRPLLSSRGWMVRRSDTGAGIDRGKTTDEAIYNARQTLRNRGNEDFHKRGEAGRAALLQAGYKYPLNPGGVENE